MQENTMTAVRALLRADATLGTAERGRLLALLRNPQGEAPEGPRVLRPKEAARRLGCCKRTVANLRRAGTLEPVRLPGRSRILGYRAEDVFRLIDCDRIAGRASREHV